MIDATILIPTFRHAALLPYSVRSALDQADASVEVSRRRGRRRGRHTGRARTVRRRRARALLRLPEGGAARRAQPPRGAPRGGRRDRLLPLRRRPAAAGTRRRRCEALLEDADLAHSPHFWIDLDGTLELPPAEHGPRGVRRAGALGNRVDRSLRGGAHPRRLPAPPARLADDAGRRAHRPPHVAAVARHPGFRGAAGSHATFLWFPSIVWGKIETSERAAALEDWFRRSREPGFAEELDALTRSAVLRSAEDENLRAQAEKRALADVLATRTWRLRQRLVSARPLRALLARRRGAR